MTTPNLSDRWGVRYAHHLYWSVKYFKTVPGYACRSLNSLTGFACIFTGYLSAVPFHGHIYIFSSLPVIRWRKRWKNMICYILFIIKILWN